jgi:hypothetical protein
MEVDFTLKEEHKLQVFKNSAQETNWTKEG